MPCGMTGRWAKARAKADTKKRGGAGAAAVIVKKIQAEAKANGATLKNAGKGGLDPNLAYAAFKRSGWKCSIPGCKTARENLDLDHIGGHELEIEADPKATAWLKEQAAKGKQNNTDGVHALCARHHDLVHQRERSLEDGKKPEPLKP